MHIPSFKEIFGGIFGDFYSACRSFYKSIKEEENSDPDIVILESLLQAARNGNRPVRSMMEVLYGMYLEIFHGYSKPKLGFLPRENHIHNNSKKSAYLKLRAVQEDDMYLDGIPGILREIYKRMFNTDASDRLIDNVYRDYHDDNELPPWVRDWIRTKECQELCERYDIPYELSNNNQRR